MSNVNILKYPNLRDKKWNKTKYNKLIKSTKSLDGNSDGVITFKQKKSSKSYVYCYDNIAPKIPAP